MEERECVHNQNLWKIKVFIIEELKAPLILVVIATHDFFHSFLRHR